MIDLDQLVNCKRAEMPKHFPDYSWEELKVMRASELKRRNKRLLRQRANGDATLSDLRRQDDAQRGSERLRIAILKAIVRQSA